MKVEAMVLRFSKPSSSALTSPSAGDTHGLSKAARRPRHDAPREAGRAGRSKRAGSGRGMHAASPLGLGAPGLVRKGLGEAWRPLTR